MRLGEVSRRGTRGTLLAGSRPKSIDMVIRMVVDVQRAARLDYLEIILCLKVLVLYKTLLIIQRSNWL